MIWKVVQIHWAGYGLRLSLPCLHSKFLDGRGCRGIFITTCSLFFVLFHGSYSCDEEDKVKKKNNNKYMRKKTKKKKSGRWLLRRVVSSWLRFSTVGTGPRPHIARQLRVTRSWKVLPGKTRTWSIRSKYNLSKHGRTTAASIKKKVRRLKVVKIYKK